MDLNNYDLSLLTLSTEIEHVRLELDIQIYNDFVFIKLSKYVCFYGFNAFFMC